MTALSSRSLSAFQLLMREWSALAPYNFIHAMRLPGPADIDRWQNAVAEAAQTLIVEPEKIRVEQPATNLETHLDAELHRPFTFDHAPFRFFAIDAGADGHWFVAVIDHWAADDFSCRVLLQRIYEIYQGRATSSPNSPLEWTAAPSSRRGLFRAWYRFLKESLRMRRACRTALGDPIDFNVRTFRARFPEGALEANRTLARENGATLHDVILASTAQAFGAARDWEGVTRRDAVGVASAMDLRRFESGQGQEKFGLHIGYYIVIAKRPHELSLPELIKRIAVQTRRLKAVPGTELFGPALWLWRRSRSNHSKATFYARGAPVVAGLSNVNLTGSWIEQADIQEYRRLGPTGPIVPMVLMITTFRGQIFIDVTFRTAAFTLVEAKRLIGSIIHRLANGA
jgi:hypothetical protein